MSHCQQFELYASEGHVPSGRTFETLDEMQAYVDDMRETAVWRRQYAMVLRVECYWSHGRKGSVGGWYADTGSGVIEMDASCHGNELVVCHEVAHVLAAARYGSHAHDPWFAATYLELVWSMMGPEAYKALDDAFHAHGIDHTHDSAIPAGRAPAN